MKRVQNLHAGRGTRAALVIVPAVLLILLMSGVVAKPTLGLEAARRQRAEAAVREHEFELERARADQLERGGGVALIECARAAIESTIPLRQSALDLQNILVLTAAQQQVSLESIEIGTEIETEFAALDDRIAAVEVSLRGRGLLGDFVAFVEAVQTLPLAASVSEARLSRPTATEPRFEFRVTLTFHHRAALLPAQATRGGGGP